MRGVWARTLDPRKGGDNYTLRQPKRQPLRPGSFPGKGLGWLAGQATQLVAAIAAAN